MSKNSDLINGTANGGFSPDDIVNASALIQELCLSDEPLALLLREHFAKAGLLPAPEWAGTDPDKFKAKTAEELNRIIGGNPLYTPERFAHVKLSAYARKLLRKNLAGPTLVSLHKVLLLDALPKHLRRKPGRGKNLLQKPATVNYSEATGKYLLLVTLVEPRELEGQMRSGRQKFERQTEGEANELCAEINAKLFGKELARQLTKPEIEITKKFFWESLEPNHPDWIDHLDKLVDHCEKTDFRVHSEELPPIKEAMRIFWRERVLSLEHESQLNYRSMFGFMLPVFGHLKPHQMTDAMILRYAYGKEKVKFLSTSYKHGQTAEEAEARMWDTAIDSDSERPWEYYMVFRFLTCIRKFKNWMHESEDPETQEQRNWCNPSKIKIRKKAKVQTKVNLAEGELSRDNDPECIHNPALTIPQVLALIDVAWVAYEGLYFPFYLHALWCGTRVKETRKTQSTALDESEGVLSVPSTVDKTDRGREVEVYPNVIIMAAALKSAGKYTAKGLRAHPDARAVIAILAGFTSGSKKRLERAEKERQRIKRRLGIDLPKYNWGRAFPRNALRRTALSMHYKLFFKVAVTTAWGGNSPGIFKEYYKRLVTKEEAREYWTMLPTWLKNTGEIEVELPEHHKLDTSLTEKVKATATAACNAMAKFQEGIASAKARDIETRNEERLEKNRIRARLYQQKQKAERLQSGADGHAASNGTATGLNGITVVA